MILPLRLIGGLNPYIDYQPKLVNETNFPIIIICAIFLCIAYFKVKSQKYDFGDSEIQQNSKECLQIQSYDVLMQPKRVYKEFSSIDKVTRPIPYKKTVIAFLICLFYYLLFTGRI